MKSKKPDNSTLTWTGPMSLHPTLVSDWVTWETECGRYRVVRSVSKLHDQRITGFATLAGGGNKWNIVAHTKLGDTYAKYFKSLQAALHCVREFHQTVTGTKVEVTNEKQIVEAAEVNGLARVEKEMEEGDLPSDILDANNADVCDVKTKTEIASRKEPPMKVQFKEALEMFTEMGCHSAKKQWKTAEKLLSKIKVLPEAILEDPAYKPESKKGTALFDSILASLKTGKEIEVVGSPDAKEKVKSEKQAKAKAKPSTNGHAPRERKDGEMTALDAAYAVMKGLKTGLSARSIWERIDAKKLWSTLGKTPSQTLSAALQRDVRKSGSRFVKTGEGYVLAK